MAIDRSFLVFYNKIDWIKIALNFVVDKIHFKICQKSTSWLIKQQFQFQTQRQSD